MRSASRLVTKLVTLTVLGGTAKGAGAAPIFTNGIYQARVSSHATTSLGTWSAATDAGHPVGGGKDLTFDEFFGDITTTTNGSSLRVYDDSGGFTDYTNFGPASPLDPYHLGDTASGLGTAGVQTIWDVAPASLLIVQDVFIVGASFEDSAVYHTVEISNLGSAAVDIGWRNLYDWQVDDPFTDDGPNNSVETSAGVVVPATTREFSHTPSPGELVRVAIDPGTASYEPLLGLGYDPGLAAGFPVTLPEAYAYVSWPLAVGTAFDYPAFGFDADEDSAGLSWFGRTAETAITLAPSQSTRITQVLFGVAPGGAPPGGVVPEPSSLALLGIGLLLLGASRQRT